MRKLTCATQVHRPRGTTPPAPARGLALAAALAPVALLLLAVVPPAWATAAPGASPPAAPGQPPAGSSSPAPGSPSATPGRPSPARSGGAPVQAASPAPAGPPVLEPGMPVPSPACLARGGQSITRSLKAEPWAQRALDFRGAWGITRGKGVTVAVVDSGIDFTGQLRGRVWRADFTGPAGPASPGYGEDCVGHGTAVASIIAAGQQKGDWFYGVAPQADILAIRVQASENTRSLTRAQQQQVLGNIASGIIYAVQHHAQVINVSIQVSPGYPQLQQAVEYALHHNVVVVASAGNDNASGSGHGPYYPASYPGVLSVNAAQADGEAVPGDARRTPVTVTAPGLNIVADYAYGEFASWDGTSFATAFAAGEAALVRAAYPQLSASQVVRRIVATADGNTGAHTGAGMINPVQAVTAVLPQPGASPAAGPGPVTVPARTGVNPLTRVIALTVAGGAIASACMVLVAAAVVPQGRKRHWRPGRQVELAGTPAAQRGPARRPALPAGPRASGARTQTGSRRPASLRTIRLRMRLPGRRQGADLAIPRPSAPRRPTAAPFRRPAPGLTAPARGGQPSVTGQSAPAGQPSAPGPSVAGPSAPAGQPSVAGPSTRARAGQPFVAGPSAPAGQRSAPGPSVPGPVSQPVPDRPAPSTVRAASFLPGFSDIPSAPPPAGRPPRARRPWRRRR